MKRPTPVQIVYLLLLLLTGILTIISLSFKLNSAKAEPLIILDSENSPCENFSTIDSEQQITLKDGAYILVMDGSGQEIDIEGPFTGKISDITSINQFRKDGVECLFCRRVPWEKCKGLTLGS